MTTNKEYRAVKANAAGTTDLRIDLQYDLGGYSYVDYRPKARGYYLVIVPVKREQRSGWNSESFTAFTGIRQLVKEVTRQSKKAEAEARALADTKLDELIAYVCRSNGLELA